MKEFDRPSYLPPLDNTAPDNQGRPTGPLPPPGSSDLPQGGISRISHSRVSPNPRLSDSRSLPTDKATSKTYLDRYLGRRGVKTGVSIAAIEREERRHPGIQRREMKDVISHDARLRQAELKDLAKTDEKIKYEEGRLKARDLNKDGLVTRGEEETYERKVGRWLDFEKKRMHTDYAGHPEKLREAKVKKEIEDKIRKDLEFGSKA